MLEASSSILVTVVKCIRRGGKVTVVSEQFLTALSKYVRGVAVPASTTCLP